MADFTQETVYLSISTPLGADALVLHALNGEERISSPFHFNLELRAAAPDVDFSQLVGKGATITLGLPDGSLRYLHGLLTRFVQGGTKQDFTTYFAELRPTLWLLTLMRDCQIFQNKTAVEIITAILTAGGVTDVRDATTATYTAREYCVQYQESHFDFIHRLMEDEGIFYFFEHADGTHTLVLADDADAHVDCPGLTSATVEGAHTDPRPGDMITDCALEQAVTTNAYAVDDFNFELPSTDLKSEVTGATPALKVYDYPGGFSAKDKGEGRAKLRLAALEEQAKTLRGRGRIRAFAAGFKFTLAGHVRTDLNASYVLRAVTHQADETQYSNTFEALPAATPFRAQRRTARPAIYGAQTAIVVGKSGEEIWTDKYGRVKVQFHWDQVGTNDENSSCWIRVAQGWAGKGWGNIFIPRIGQEVLVTFLDGDPDRPLITGSVYNAEQTVPYALPDNQTRSTLQSRSSKEGTAGNELRFEDKKDSEELYLHAQKDMLVLVENDWTRTVLHDDKTTIKNSRTTEIQEADETLTVTKGNRTVSVAAGNETHDVKGTRAVTVTGDETHTNEAKFTHDVTGDYTLTVSGNLTIDVSGDVLIKSAKGLTTKAGLTLLNQAGTDLTNKAGKDLLNNAQVSLTNKAGVSLTNDGGVSLESKASASQTVDGGGMLTLKGGLVKLN